MLCENSQKEVVINNPQVPRVSIEDEELSFIMQGLDCLYESRYTNGDESAAKQVLDFKNKLLDASKKEGSTIIDEGNQAYQKCEVCDD